MELNDVETCCGFGGTFAVKFEPISIAMARTKSRKCISYRAEYLISTDLSCLMHLQGYIDNKKYPLKTMHLPMYSPAAGDPIPNSFSLFPSGTQINPNIARMKKAIRQLYDILPFKKQLFTLLRNFDIPEKIYRHLSFKGVIRYR